MLRIGMLGCGFLATFYMQGLEEVPGAQVTVVYGRNKQKATDFANRWEIPQATDDMEAAISSPEVDMVVIALPNNIHLPATLLIAKHKKHVVCSKPLGRNADEARQMLDAVQKAGILHGYGETQVFNPSVIAAKNLIDEGSIGRILVVRAREAHSGPHAPHFWDIEQSGGGSLLDMGCHTIEVARYLLGKEIKPVEVMAWTDTMVHKEKTAGDDTAIALVRFENGVMSQNEVAWTARGSFDLRNEVYGSDGSIYTDSTRSTPITAFVRSTNAYLLEKAESNTGWISPLPDEARAYGYHEEVKHFVKSIAKGEMPRETFEDGYIINLIIDAAYQSSREHRWISLNL
jgi:predicted dehydrogenase